MYNKVVTPQAAAALINTGDVVTTSGFVGIGVPDELLIALENRFLETQHPKNITLFFAAGQGDGKFRGLNRLAHKGLVKRVIGGHWGLIPKLAKLAIGGEIEAYNLPQGVISHIFRDIAAGKPGTITHVGLGTFVDPRLQGGKINSKTREDIVEVTHLGGRENLFYKAFPINVALLRGTTADPSGNVTMEREALTIDNLAQAMAVKNSGGIVIVQVEQIAALNSLNPRNVVLPSVLVDAIVIGEPQNHMQTYATPFSALFAGLFRAPEGALAPSKLDVRKIISRRAAFELPVNGIVNLGIGMPEGVASVAAEEGILDHLTLTAEPGVIGGQPASGLDFGAAINTNAIIDQNQQFDFYDGGGLDLAVLGMAQVDVHGNVNVSKFGSRLAGAGGFINISQNAQHVVFTGTFTTGGLDVEIYDGRLKIIQEGICKKFETMVDQITFSGMFAKTNNKPVLFITERCVFELTAKGVALREIAPGIDLKNDILSQMSFTPIIDELIEMDRRIFVDEPMGLKVDLLHLDMNERIVLLQEDRRLFINLEKFRIKDANDIQKIKNQVVKVCSPLSERVDVIVNYDGTHIEDDILEYYVDMVGELTDKYYKTVTRYSYSAFKRLKIGETFKSENNSHIFVTVDDATLFLDRIPKP
jgi:propionate CoA-transferase